MASVTVPALLAQPGQLGRVVVGGIEPAGASCGRRDHVAERHRFNRGGDGTLGRTRSSICRISSSGRAHVGRPPAKAPTYRPRSALDNGGPNRVTKSRTNEQPASSRCRENPPALNPEWFKRGMVTSAGVGPEGLAQQRPW
jgi:hypothetical protein